MSSTKRQSNFPHHIELSDLILFSEDPPSPLLTHNIIHNTKFVIKTFIVNLNFRPLMSREVLPLAACTECQAITLFLLSFFHCHTGQHFPYPQRGKLQEKKHGDSQRSKNSFGTKRVPENHN